MIDNNHPGYLLLNVERGLGLRQYLSVEVDGAIFWNWSYYCEFLYWRIGNPGDDILEENIFIVLSSIDIIAPARVRSILNLSICLTTR